MNHSVAGRTHLAVMLLVVVVLVVVSGLAGFEFHLDSEKRLENLVLVVVVVLVLVVVVSRTCTPGLLACCAETCTSCRLDSRLRNRRCCRSSSVPRRAGSGRVLVLVLVLRMM